MKPIEILNIMDLAWAVRKTGENFYPLFTGDSGLGKSEIVQLWVRQQQKRNPNFLFIDLRIAYLEAPDMVGFPHIVTATIEKNGKKEQIQTTLHALPDFLPREENAEGLLLFEEPNRGTTGVMNCMMQILTDRKVHGYSLPKGIVMAGCINPDNALYDVNSMDTALRNRFVEYEITYDHKSFVEYIEKAGWNEKLVAFIKSGIWIYKEALSIGREGKYISPRTTAQMNSAEQTGLQKNRQLHFITACSILGKDVGKEYHNFIFNESPVLYTDLLTNLKASLKKLKTQSSADSYRGDMIGVTIESIIKHYIHKEEDTEDKIGIKTMIEVACVIPADQALNLLQGCVLQCESGKVSEEINNLKKKYPKIVDILKSNIKIKE